MNKQLDINKWIQERIVILEKEVKHTKIKDRFWTILLLLVNILTIFAATLALIFLFLNPKDEILMFKKGDLPLIFTVISLLFIILTFIFQIINKFYLSRMKDKIYQSAINKLKIELVRFKNKIGIYKDDDADQKLINNLVKIDNDLLIATNIKKSKFREAFLSIAKGEK